MTKIFYQGRPGAYSEIAGKKLKDYLGEKFEILPVSDFEELFNVAIRGTGISVVPVENSTAGSVIQNIDLFLENKARVYLEIIIPVKHQLYGIKNSTLKKIKTVYSHPQALSQSKKFLNSHGITPVEYFDTAGAVQKIAELGDPSIGALGSSCCLDHYDVKIIKKDVQDQDHNQTRFLVIADEKNSKNFRKIISSSRLKTTIVFETKNLPSVLYKCLGALATNGFNLLKIESRPNPNSSFKYRFFLDVEGDAKSVSFESAIHEMEFVTESLNVLGTYQTI